MAVLVVHCASLRHRDVPTVLRNRQAVAPRRLTIVNGMEAIVVASMTFQ